MVTVGILIATAFIPNSAVTIETAHQEVDPEPIEQPVDEVVEVQVEPIVQPQPQPTAVKRTLNVKPGVEQWRGLVSSYFPSEQVETALRVMSCESGGNHLSVNNNPRTKDYSVGLYQINLYGSLANSRPSEEWLKSPENNIQYASQMWSRQGWGPWSCFRKI